MPAARPCRLPSTSVAPSWRPSGTPAPCGPRPSMSPCRGTACQQVPGPRSPRLASASATCSWRWVTKSPRVRSSRPSGSTLMPSTSPKTIRPAPCRTVSMSRRRDPAWCCARTPPRCRCVPCSSVSYRSMWCAPDGRFAPTRWTPPTPRCSTRSKGSRWTRASPWRTSKAPWTPSRGPCSARPPGPGCDPRSSRSPSPPPRSMCGSRSARGERVGWSGAAAEWSIPMCCAPAGSTPPSIPASPSAWASNALCSSATASPTCGTWSRAMSGSPAHSEWRPEPMRVPVSWLRDHVALPEGDAAPTVDQIADAFVRAGLEVEAVHQLGPVSGPLVVGLVTEIEELPGFAKPIRYCLVDDGALAPRGVVCGATNFAAGDLVVLARPGTVLPGDVTIGARTAYGRTSDGMICSAAELRLGDDHTGIIVPPADAAAPGDSAADVLGLDDAVIELAITPDRGYCLSVRGLARELAIAFDVPYGDPGLLEVPQVDVPSWPVHIEDEQGCRRFVVRQLSGVHAGAESPWWMRRRLQLAGMRPIPPAGDVPHHVMV